MPLNILMKDYSEMTRIFWLFLSLLLQTLFFERRADEDITSPHLHAQAPMLPSQANATLQEGFS